MRVLDPVAFSLLWLKKIFSYFPRRAGLVCSGVLHVFREMTLAFKRHTHTHRQKEWESKRERKWRGRKRVCESEKETKIIIMCEKKVVRAIGEEEREG